jgi:galactose-1-phosphate uridylyltransferase
VPDLCGAVFLSCALGLRRGSRESARGCAGADFVSLAPFASRSPFEVSVFPKFHRSAFSRISPVQIEKLARVLRDVLQKLDKTLSGPPYNLALQDRPFLRCPYQKLRPP